MYNLLKSIAMFHLYHRNLFPANRILFFATRILKRAAINFGPLYLRLNLHRRIVQ